MLKVLTLVGTRPEIIRLSLLIKEIDKFCDHTFVHSGQNYDYELNQIFFDELGIRKPDIFLNSVGKNVSDTIGNIISKIDKILEKNNYDAFIVLGDTNTCLGAISAKRRKVPIFHMEAGNRCFDFRVPEEINRKIVDHIADINLTYSEIAREYLLREGLPPAQIIKTGSPMKEIFLKYNKSIEDSKILKKLDLSKDKYFLVSLHREENVDKVENLRKIIDISNFLYKEYSLPIVFSAHPRTRNNLKKHNLELPKNVINLKPFGFFDYVKLEINSKCVLSDSGSITEEASILNFKALNLRDMHERPEGFEECHVMFTGLNIERIKACLKILESKTHDSKSFFKVVKDYDVDNFSKKVIRIIHSYVDYVNHYVWKKNY